MQRWISSVLLLTFQRVKIGWRFFHQYLEIFHYGKGVNYLTSAIWKSSLLLILDEGDFVSPVDSGGHQITVSSNLTFSHYFLRDLRARSQTEAPVGDVQLGERSACFSVSPLGHIFSAALWRWSCAGSSCTTGTSAPGNVAGWRKKTTLLSWAWSKEGSCPRQQAQWYV